MFKIAALTSLAMAAFASNSLLCRAALRESGIDAASFTTIRLVSGALVLWLLVRLKPGPRTGGNWRSALALFGYAGCFSYAYLSLTAATGALLLFGAVQATMIGYGLWAGERLNAPQLAGLVLALGGLIGLLLPGLAAPPLIGSALMLSAGVCWGIYSLRGRGGGDPLAVTAGNFVRAVPVAALLCLLVISRISLEVEGALYAIASGFGYAIWYTALPGLKATNAATIQLSVPVLAAFGGVVLLGEPLTLRLALASIAILGGIALVVRNPSTRTPPAAPRHSPLRWRKRGGARCRSSSSD